MFFDRRRLNIFLIVIMTILGGTAGWLALLPVESVKDGTIIKPTAAENKDTIISTRHSDTLITTISADTTQSVNSSTPNTSTEDQSRLSQTDIISKSEFKDIDPKEMIGNHPFRKEAIKVLSSNLEETDSLNRRKILSYCEHLRTSYTTKDIDFIRQVFSDNALIIVGSVVKSGKKLDGGNDAKVLYAVRSKHSYLSKLNEIFMSNKSIHMDFSDFKIMRHTSIKGIYGVSLRQ